MTVQFRNSTLGVLGLGFAVTVGFCTACHRPTEAEASIWPGRRQLAECLGPFRPGIGRWIGLPFARPHSPLDSRTANWPHLRRVASQLEATSLSPEQLADLALLRLATGHPRDASAALEEAVAINPRDPRFWSDLSATWLARAETEQQPLHLVLSLEAANSALRLNPRFAPAMINQARALESLSLSDQARSSWRHLQNQDEASAWVVEAKAALAVPIGTGEAEAWRRARAELYRAFQPGRDDASAKRIGAAVTRRFVQASRQLAEDRLLGEWSESRVQGRELKGAAVLCIAHVIGDTLASQNQDLLLQRSVQAIEKALAGDLKAGGLAQLVTGHRTFKIARSLYEFGDLARAAIWFGRSRVALTAAGSPFAYWAAFYGSICTYYVPDRSAALVQLQRLQRQISDSSFLSLKGRIQWMLGLIAFETGDWTKALGAYRTALAQFQACREPENEAAVENLLAVTFDYLGDEESAWRHRLNSLTLIPRVLDNHRLVNIFGAAAHSLANAHPTAGVAFARQNVVAAIASGKPHLVTVAYWQSALLEHAVGNDHGAMADLVKATENVSRVPDTALRLQETADVEFAYGLVNSAHSPVAALASLKLALDSYQHAGYLFSIPQILAARARIYLAAGQTAMGRGELLRGIAATEALSGRLSEEDLRAPYLSQSLDVYDEMAHLEVVHEQQPGAAFEYVERRRAQQLVNSFARNSGARHFAVPAPIAPLGLSEVQQSLPPEAVLIEYLVTDDALIVFLVRRSGIRAVVVEHQAGPLKQLLSALAAASELHADAAGFRDVLAGLGDRLLRPLLPEMGKASILVFVPDKMLFAVPFSALIDPRDGSYLVEHYRISVSLSAILYAQARSRVAATKPGRRTRALLVADPAFNPDLFPSLSRLAAASTEVAELRRLYPQAKVLEGAAATRQAFLLNLANAELVQFSGHAVVHSDLPGRSVLVLADEPDGAPGALYARDLAGLSLPNTRLVILAACSTGRGAPDHSDGISSLARPFLVAGVPAVIATLWSVEDYGAAQLSRALHRRLVTSVDSVNALRDAQLELLRGSEISLRSPFAWASYEILGTAVELSRARGQPTATVLTSPVRTH